MSLDEARLLANVNERAHNLFECGYRAKWLGDALIEVTTPKKRVYQIDTDAKRCSCPFFVKHEGKYGCKHLLGYLLLLMKIQQVRACRLRHCFNPKHSALWPEWERAAKEVAA